MRGEFTKFLFLLFSQASYGTERPNRGLQRTSISKTLFICNSACTFDVGRALRKEIQAKVRWV